jgi:hypothetical protein
MGSVRNLPVVASVVGSFVELHTVSMCCHGAGAVLFCTARGPGVGTATFGSRTVANPMPFYAIPFLHYQLI